MSERSDLRRELRAQGLQNTQRSWDNYVGDKPIKSWEKDGYYDKARSVLSNNGEDDDEIDPITGKRKKKKSADDKPSKPPVKAPTKSKLKEALDTVRGFGSENSATEKPSWRSKSTADPIRSTAEKDDGSMLPRGYRLNDKGQVLNTAGYIQDEDWYTIDEKTGKKRLKNLKERPLYDGGDVERSGFYS